MREREAAGKSVAEKIIFHMRLRLFRAGECDIVEQPVGRGELQAIGRKTGQAFRDGMSGGADRSKDQGGIVRAVSGAGSCGQCGGVRRPGMCRTNAEAGYSGATLHTGRIKCAGQQIGRELGQGASGGAIDESRTRRKQLAVESEFVAVRCERIAIQGAALAPSEIFVGGGGDEISGEELCSITALQNDAAAVRRGDELRVRRDQFANELARLIQAAVNARRGLGRQRTGVIARAEAVEIVDGQKHYSPQRHRGTEK